MSVRTIFETCRPRGDVLRGTVAEADFAADLAQVVTGKGSAEYVDPARFFANTYPTRGLKNLLANVCRRLSGAGGEAAAIFRLDTSYGGGKTHGLIALAHAARGLAGVAGVGEFIDPALLPQGPVGLAAFDGENADPANGRTMGEGRPGAHAVGRAGVRARGDDGIRAGEEQRCQRRLTGRRHATGAVRGAGDAHSARRALGVPPQGAAERCRPRAVDRVPDVSLQGRGGDAARSARLHARHRQGGPGGRRLLGGEPVHRRPDGGGRERIGAQGDAAQSDRGGRDGSGAAPAPVRVHRRCRRTGSRHRLSSRVVRETRCHRGRREPPGDCRELSDKLSAAPRGPADVDLEDRDAGDVPARPRHAAAAGAHDRASLGDPPGGRHGDTPAPRRSGLRADTAGDRHPPSAVPLRTGHRQRRGGIGRNPCAGAGHRCEAPRRHAAVRDLRGAHHLHAHAGVQRPAQGAVARAVALFDAGAVFRRQFHRRGPEEVHSRVRLSRRSARRADAVPGGSEPHPDHPSRGEERRFGRGPRRAERPHRADLQGRHVRRDTVPRRSLRRAGRRGRRTAEVGRAWRTTP